MERVLTTREKAIIYYLIEQSGNQSTEQLSTLFKVSVRTIQYDMAYISEWLESNGGKLEKKRSQGYAIRTNREGIKEKLLENHSCQVLDKNIRCRNIIVFILLSKKFVTTRAISEFLDISQSTLVNDLLLVKKEVKKYNLYYVTKKGLGVFINGAEMAKRHALEVLIRDSLDEYQIYKVIELMLNNGSLEPSKFTIHEEINSIFNQVITSIDKIIRAGNYNEYEYTEILVIILRFTIALIRGTIEEHFHFDNAVKYPTNLELYQEAEAIFNKNNLKFSEAEYRYIFRYEDKTIQGEIIELTKDLIYKVSLKTNMPFYHDLQLQTSLYSHLFLYANKEEHYKNEYSPFTNELRQKYPQLYEAVFSSVKNLFRMKDEKFVTYIVLHFLVSLEKIIEGRVKLKTLYVCSTGLGVANLVNQMIQKRFDQLDIVGVVSIMEVNEILNHHDLDLIISVFPIEHESIPCVKVQAIPDENDYFNIASAIQEIIQGKDYFEIASYLFTDESTSNSRNQQPLKTEDKNMTLIYQSFFIHGKICEIFGIKKESSHREALLIHIMLCINRIAYDRQLTVINPKVSELTAYKNKLLIEIKYLFRQQKLSINEVEALSILYYCDGNWEEVGNEK